MNALTPTSIARVQTLTKQMSPTPEPNPEFEGLSEKQLDDLAAVKRLQRPLISGAPNISTYSGVAPLQLMVQEGRIGLGDAPKGDSKLDGSLASLVYASYEVSDVDSVDSPVLDLLA